MFGIQNNEQIALGLSLLTYRKAQPV